MFARTRLHKAGCYSVHVGRKTVAAINRTANGWEVRDITGKVLKTTALLVDAENFAQVHFARVPTWNELQSREY